jgi:diacylglycerol kinase (ATP)
MKKIYNNLLNSINGIRIALREHSFICEIIIGIILIPFIFMLETLVIYKLLVLIVYLLLLAFEIFNTSVEKLCNKITKEIDEDIRQIKDLASASVFIIIIILIIMVIFVINI